MKNVKNDIMMTNYIFNIIFRDQIQIVIRTTNSKIETKNLTKSYPHSSI